MIDTIHKCDIKPGYRSDHSFLKMHITINPFERGKGIWKFNNNLLYQKDYLSLINERKNKICHEFLKSSDNIQFTI